MAKLRMTLACADNDRTRALIDGTVQPTGIDLTYLPLIPEESFWRTLRHAEFDASELSSSAYLMELSRGNNRFVAIPVYPTRHFRHSWIFVHSESGIAEPADLVGKRVGVPEYHMTAALWIRGMLQHDYGVYPEQMTWYRGGQEHPGREERVQLPLLRDVPVHEIPPDATLSALLEAGELDALFGAYVPSPFRRGSPRVRRLFKDVRAVEADYYRRTGIYPIMHLVVIKRELYEREPWVAGELYKAFCAAKEVCYARIEHYSAGYITPWFNLDFEDAQAALGPDLYPYGVQANLPTLEALTSYSFEQGLSARQVGLEEIFAPNTLDAFVV